MQQTASCYQVVPDYKLLFKIAVGKKELFSLVTLLYFWSEGRGVNRLYQLWVESLRMEAAPCRFYGGICSAESPGDLLRSLHHSLQVFVVVMSSAAIPNSDADGSDDPNNTAVEVAEDLGQRDKLPSPPQEGQLCGVECLSEVLSDAQVFEAAVEGGFAVLTS